VVKVVKGLAGWGMCFRTVTFDSPSQTLTSWKDTIAIGMGSGDIITLDGVTGIQTAIFSGHTSAVRDLTFTQDGVSLVSGSCDNTIKLWDVQTGGIIHTFCGHTSWVLSVSISPDCAMIASGSQDKTIHLWDIQKKECCHVIEQKGCTVRFFPTGPKHLVFSDGDEIWQWDTNGQQVYPVNNDFNLALSPDGTQLALCQWEGLVVQHTDSGKILAKFHTPSGLAHTCCISPSGRYMAAAAEKTAHVWDITSSDTRSIESFVGHTEGILELVFSSDFSLASLSNDKSVKFWQIGALTTDPVVADPELTLLSTPIMSITLQAKDGVAISSDASGLVRVWDLSTGLCNRSFQTPTKDPIRVMSS